MSKYDVEVLNNIEAIRLAEAKVVDKIPIFQQADWLLAVGRDLRAIVCHDAGGTIQGYMPLVKTSKLGLWGFHVPPFTPYFGPTVFSARPKDKIAVLIQLMKPLGKSLLDFKLPLTDGDLLPYLASGFSVEAYQNHLVDCAEGVSEESFSADKRRDVHRLLQAVKDGRLHVQENSIDFAQLLELWNKTSKRANFRSGEESLKRILYSKNLKSYYANVILDSYGNALAGTYCPFDGAKMYHLIGASAKVDDTLFRRANILSLYLAMQDAARRKLIFDFEGSSIAGIASFYRMMGGEPRVVLRLHRVNSIYHGAVKIFRSLTSQV